MEKELNSKQYKELFAVIADLKSPKDCKKFLRDICTIAELQAMSERWQVAKKVKSGESYRKISKQTGASTATITRVAHWLNHGAGGYSLMLDQLKI